MSTYLIHFAVYALAMVGVIFVCLMVFKKSMLNQNCTKKIDGLSVEDSLNLSQRKTLYVIKAGNEKFLVAADTERTTFLAKLGESFVSQIPLNEPEYKVYKEVPAQKTVDYSEVMNSLNKGKKPVLKEMLRKLNEPLTKNEQSA